MTNVARSNLGERFKSSPLLVRTVPFLVFLGLTFCQGKWGEESRYWFYLAKTIVGALLLWIVWPRINELRLVLLSLPGVMVGAVVFVLWVGLDGYYPALEELLDKGVYPLLRTVGWESHVPGASTAAPWNPFLQFGSGSVMAWFFVVVRMLGSTLVVPPLEEVFYRSFLYRYIAKPDFQQVPLGQFHWMPFLVTSLIFGLTHHEWLAGILCGLAFQGLVCWKKRLGDAITAHAVTNLLLGLWVINRDAWKFW